MNGDSLTLGNVTHDRVTRQGLTAAGKFGQQITHAMHLHIARGRTGPGLMQDGFNLLSVLEWGSHALCGIYNLGGFDFTNSHHGKKLVHTFLIEVLGQFLITNIGKTHALEFTLDNGATISNILFEVLSTKPMLYMLACFVGDQVTQIGIHPVATRATFFNRQHFNLITGT